MKGPVILLGLVVALAGILYWALVGPGGADVQRGLEETDLAFSLVEAEIRALDEDFIPLTRQGYMLNLRRQHEELRDRLAVLKARRLEVREDEALVAHQRLDAFREIVDATDELYAQAKSLHRRTEARYAFMIEVSPLLQRARALRDLLDAADCEDEALRVRRDALAGSFADLEQGAKTADTVLQQNVTQGETLAGAELRSLRELVEEQRKLAAAMGVEVPEPEPAQGDG